jgi:hypothetical protein
LTLVNEWKKEFGIKAGTFKFSPISIRDVATVDYKGKLTIWDIERGQSKYEV